MQRVPIEAERYVQAKGRGNMALSRRQFLTGVGVAGVAAAGAGLVGCSPSSTQGQSTPAASGATAAPDTGLIAAASLNPQDYEYRQNTTELKTLFSPVAIGPIELSHRMVKSAAGSACYLAGLTDELYEYYVNFAKGGVEMIWVEMVDELAPMSGKTTPEAEEFARKLVAGCKEHGSHLGYQNYAFTPKSANEMTVDEIHAFQDSVVNVCKMVHDYGFEAFEINAAGFNIGESFLSRVQNIREDEYGPQSLENRARYVVELIEKIKEACGDDFVVQVLINCIEADDANLGNDAKVTSGEEGIEFAKLFEAAGADSMHLRLGPLSYHPCQFASDLYFLLNGIEGATGFGTQWDFNRHWQGQLIGDHSGAGMLLDVVARYKEALSIPCGTVTYMDPAHAPDFFEQALADGKCDFYLMNRPFTVDIDYVNKLREGRIDEIAPCTRCLHCHIAGNQDNADRGYCRVNALTQRVMRENGPATYELPPIESPKNVMVIGGGPGGMEAARIAAERGHQVTLYEKKGSLGGLLDFASSVKGPHENLEDFKAYLEKQLELTGVNVVLNTEVDSALVESEAPDAVILAVGGLRDELGVSGSDSVQVIELDQFMTTEMGENVVVYGSNAQAFDCALWLTVHNKHVTMVTPSPLADIDKQQSEHAKDFITSALYSLGMRVWPNASIKEIGDGQITVATEVGTETTILCDAIVNAADMLPNTALIDGVSVAETYAVGDCAEPYNIALAVRGGNDAGRAV